jgi:hypothetical protein
MAVANIQAYYNTATITAVISFIVQALELNLENFFQPLLLACHNKLECLSLPFTMR